MIAGWRLGFPGADGRLSILHANSATVCTLHLHRAPIGQGPPGPGWLAVSFGFWLHLHRAPIGQGPPGPGWLAISFGFWSGRALATGTAWAGLCLIHHHHHHQ